MGLIFEILKKRRRLRARESWSRRDLEWTTVLASYSRSYEWGGHPKRVIVESTQDFLIKAATAIDLIREQLPNCCKGHRIPELSELILPVPSIHK